MNQQQQQSKALAPYRSAELLAQKGMVNKVKYLLTTTARNPILAPAAVVMVLTLLATLITRNLLVTLLALIASPLACCIVWMKSAEMASNGTSAQTRVSHQVVSHPQTIPAQTRQAVQSGSNTTAGNTPSKVPSDWGKTHTQTQRTGGFQPLDTSKMTVEQYLDQSKTTSPDITFADKMRMAGVEDDMQHSHDFFNQTASRQSTSPMRKGTNTTTASQDSGDDIINTDWLSESSVTVVDKSR